MREPEICEDGMWELASPPGARYMSKMWVSVEKLDGDCEVIGWLKARLVGQRDYQRFGENYFTTSTASRPWVLANANIHDHTLWQVDFESAVFLNAPSDAESCMRQPKRFEDSGKDQDWVCRLEKLGTSRYNAIRSAWNNGERRAGKMDDRGEEAPSACQRFLWCIQEHSSTVIASHCHLGIRTRNLEER